MADPFHVVRHANAKLDECRRRVQNETLGHRSRKGDPLLYRIRRLLTKADERLEDSDARLLGLLRAGDPRGEVATTWHAKEAVRELYAHGDEATTREWIERLVTDMADRDNPVEVRSLRRTLARCTEQFVTWHPSHVSNGPIEAANGLIKRSSALPSASHRSGISAYARCSTPASPSGTAPDHHIPLNQKAPLNSGSQFARAVTRC